MDNMKNLKCSHVTGTLCGYVAYGKDEKEVKKKLIIHGKTDHHGRLMRHAPPEHMRMLEERMDRLLGLGAG